MSQFENAALNAPYYKSAFVYEDGSHAYQSVPNSWRIINRKVSLDNPLVETEAAADGGLQFNISGREVEVGLVQTLELAPGRYVLRAKISELVQPPTDENIIYEWEIQQGDDVGTIPARHENRLEIQGDSSQALTIAFMIRTRSPLSDGYVTVKSLINQIVSIPQADWQADMVITPPPLAVEQSSQAVPPPNEETQTTTVPEQVQRLLDVGHDLDTGVNNEALAVAMFEHIAAIIRGDE